MNVQSLTRGLAFFGVGLGLAELLAPRRLARTIGVKADHALMIRLLGLRELGAGLGLMQGSAATFLWARVGGDAIDLGLLAAALRSRRNERNRVITAIAAVAGVTVLDVVAALLATRNPAEPEWRVAREDQRGIERDDPQAMRSEADALMARHQSAHYRTPRSDTPSQEEAMARQFEPGD
jgi:hypothetical protein